MKSRIVLVFLIAGAAFTAGSQPPAESVPNLTPPDLAIGWIDKGDAVTGVAGDTVAIHYVIRNIGGRDAFAVISRYSTTLGPTPKVRIQPGPAAGKSLDRKLSLALAVGMRELCIDLTLQNVALEDPADPNLKNNRACRPVAVRESRSK